jgi:hypothetical protein
LIEDRSGFAKHFCSIHFQQASIARGKVQAHGIVSNDDPLALTVRRQAITPVLDGTRTTFDRFDWRAKPRAFEEFLSCQFTVFLEFSSHLFLRGVNPAATIKQQADMGLNRN